jgi:hypothetical protein
MEGGIEIRAGLLEVRMTEMGRGVESGYQEAVFGFGELLLVPLAVPAFAPDVKVEADGPLQKGFAVGPFDGHVNTLAKGHGAGTELSGVGEFYGWADAQAVEHDGDSWPEEDAGCVKVPSRLWFGLILLGHVSSLEKDKPEREMVQWRTGDYPKKGGARLSQSEEYARSGV